MTFLPIVVRELRVAARRKSAFRARFWSAFSAIALGTYTIYVTGGWFGAMNGSTLFDFLVIFCFLACLSLVRNTNDCLSEEKREGTLGLLFLTDLKGHDVTLGKLFSSSLISFYSILGVLPIVAVSLLFGGVTAIEFWQVVLALLNAFFFSQCAGMFVSAFSLSRRAATARTTAILLVYTAGFYVASFLLEQTRFKALAAPFEWMNPGYCVHYACTTGYLTSRFARQFGHYWSSLLLIHLNAWLFLALATWWLPHSWQDKPVKSKNRWTERLRQWYHADPSLRRRLLDKNPFLWLCVRRRIGSIKVWVALIGLNAIWIYFLCKFGWDQSGPPLFCAAIIVNHLFLKLFVASEAAGNMEEQRRSGGLEFLLSCTPLRVEEIISGQWAALRRLLVWPTVAVLLTDLGMFITFCRRSADHDDTSGFLMFVMGVVAMLFPDMIALGWVGMWKGMVQKKSRRAAGAAVMQILVLPWLILIFIATLFQGNELFKTFGEAVAFWFIVGVSVDGISGALAFQRLHAEFRARAAVHGGESIGLLGRVGRALGTAARPKPPQIKV